MLCHFFLLFKLCSWCFEQPSGQGHTSWGGLGVKTPLELDILQKLYHKASV